MTNFYNQTFLQDRPPADFIDPVIDAGGFPSKRDWVYFRLINHDSFDTPTFRLQLISDFGSGRTTDFDPAEDELPGGENARVVGKYLGAKPSSQNIGAVTTGATAPNQRASLQLTSFVPGITEWYRYQRELSPNEITCRHHVVAHPERNLPRGTPTVHMAVQHKLPSAD